MKTSFDETHEKILESAKEYFLKYGYEKTNLRDLCKSAGVTTGAFYRHFTDKESLFATLVQPAIMGAEKMYDNVRNNFAEEKVLQNIDYLWEISAHVQHNFINYIYDNLDAFTLILNCSEGTRYDGFIEKIVNNEVIKMENFYNFMEKHKFKIRRLPKTELFMLIYANYSCIFEAIMQGLSREETLNSMKTFSKFFSSGWRVVFEMSEIKNTIQPSQ